MTMIVRVRTPVGMVKLETQPNEHISQVYLKAAALLNRHPSTFVLNQQQTVLNPEDPRATVATYAIKHGDMLQATVVNGKWTGDASTTESTGTTTGTTTAGPATIKEDEVDIELSKLSGLISKTPEKSGSMRIKDLPIEPYDKKYLEEKQIKHMSFHALIRRLQNKQKDAGLGTKGEVQMHFLQDDVEDLVKRTSRKDKSTTIKITDLPSAIVLTRQEFRIVDHVEFEVGAVVDQFLQGWRSTGLQRFGFMYGRYEPYLEVPLGIKAVVCFIYEPPQIGQVDGFELNEADPDAKLVDDIAAALGLRKVGMIYTDLIDDKSGTGKVLAKRHANSYFLSSIEVLYVAGKQLDHPNYTRYSPTGKFGSKFVTVVVSGDPASDSNNNIGLAAYQVSNQAMALVKADLIQATVEPALMRVTKDDETRVVPDILFRYQNEYGTEVTQAAKPTFPVEYLIVNVNYGFPKEPRATFVTKTPFVVENRPTDAATLATLDRHLRANADNILEALSDFHLLLFIAKSGIFDMRRDYGIMIEAVRTRDSSLFAVLLDSESWRNIVAIAQAQSASNVPSAVSSASLASGNAPQPTAQAHQFTQQATLLFEMGFEDEERNLQLLQQYRGSVEEVLNRLTAH